MRKPGTGPHGGPATAGLLALGLKSHQGGDFARAEAVYRQVLQQDPRCADALHLLGCLSDQMGRAEAAAALILQAIEVNRKVPAYHYNVGNVLLRLGRTDAAIRHYKSAVRLQPDYAAAYNNLGLAFAAQGSPDAIQAFRTAVHLKPDYPDAHYNLANAWKAQGRLAKAVESYRQALALSPDNPDIHYNLANTLKASGLLDDAVRSYLAAIKLRGGDARFHTNLGAVYMEQGRLELAIQSCGEALRLRPEDHLAHSSLITATCYASNDPAALFRECERWDQQHGEPLRREVAPYANRRDATRRLRIGYVSADFRRHAVAYFVEPVLAHHDHEACEILCYSDVAKPDEVTRRLRKYADRWVDCRGMSDDEVARRIRMDEVDILVDLAGHTAGNRLLTFARKPAPVQVSWFGFPATTGIGAMDYRFTDSILDPPDETEKYYSERLIRLSRFYSCFQPEHNSPEIGALPALANGFVTFASLNNFAKVTPEMLCLWAEILQAVPSARLLLKAGGLDNGAMASEIRGFFEGKGIETERLLLQGESGILDFLRLNSVVDVVLDPFPFNGGVTSFHALWMGLPLITLAGATAASRVGKSILTRVGLSELVAETTNRYKEIAQGLAGDIDRLASLRCGMRERLSSAGLLDGDGFTREVERAYRTVWRRWCRNEGEVA